MDKARNLNRGKRAMMGVRREADKQQPSRWWGAVLRALGARVVEGGSIRYSEDGLYTTHGSRKLLFFKSAGRPGKTATTLSATEIGG